MVAQFPQFQLKYIIYSIDYFCRAIGIEIKQLKLN